MESSVIIGKGNLAGKGVYASRDFEKGEIVVHYNLKQLTEKEYQALPESEKMFTHSHWSTIYLYSQPERHVNHSDTPQCMMQRELFFIPRIVLKLLKKPGVRNNWL